MHAPRLTTLAVLGLVLAGGSVAGALPAAACTPHVDSQGPTLTVAPDYADPTRSDYSYSFDGTHVTVVTCLG